MSLTIRNESGYPTAEVRQLVRYAMKPFGVVDTLVVVSHTRNTKWRVAESRGNEYWLNAYSGTAYRGLPHDMRPWPASAAYGIKIRIGRPECFPMRRGAWRYGWEDSHRQDEWPLFRFETWQEALVAIAAHEAKHNEGYRERVSNDELRCELAAARVYAQFVTSPPPIRKEDAMSDTASETGAAELLAELRAAIEALPGVTVHDKPNYSTVKYGKTTLGYVNGRRKIRVDFPMRAKVRGNLHVTSSADVARVVAEMETFIPAGEREASPDPKPERKSRSRRKAAATVGEGEEAAAAATS
jgi:hypothetical protein